MIRWALLLVFLAAHYWPSASLELSSFKWLGISVTALTLVSSLREGRGLSVHPFYLGVTALTVAGILGSAVSNLIAPHEIARMGMNLALLWVVAYHSRTAVERRRVLIGLAVGSVAAVLIGLPGIQDMAPGDRLAGRLFNPNLFGQTAVQAAVCGLGALAGTKGMLKNVGGGAVCTIGLLGVLYSGSRGAIASSAAVLLTLIVLRRTQKSNELVFAGVLALAIVAIPQDTVGRLETTFSPRRPGGQSGVENRLGVWTAGWHSFKESPVFGVGVGNHLASASRRDVAGFALATHNMFVQCLAETGIVGTAAFGWLLLRTGKTFYLAATVRSGRREPADATFFFLMIGVFVSQLSSGNYLRPIWYILMGLALGIGNEMKREAWQRSERSLRSSRHTGSRRHHSEYSGNHIALDKAACTGEAPLGLKRTRSLRMHDNLEDARAIFGALNPASQNAADRRGRESVASERCVRS